MAITLGTPVYGTAAVSVADVVTSSITVASGEKLVVVTAGAGGDAVSGAVFDSGAQAFTYVQSRPYGAGGTAGTIEVWEINAPSAGTGTVTVTFAASAGVRQAAAFTVAGAVAGSGYRDATVRVQATSAAPSLTITSETNDVPFAALSYRDTTITFTVDGSDTQFGSNDSGSGSSHTGLRLIRGTGAASVALNGTLSSSIPHGMIGFNINLAGAGSSIAAIVSGYQQRGLM